MCIRDSKDIAESVKELRLSDGVYNEGTILQEASYIREYFKESETKAQDVEALIKTQELLLEEISYEALPENLIEKVEIDLDGKTAGDTIRVKDLPIATAEGIHLKTNPEETVVQVTEVHNAPEEEETEEAAEE